MIPTMELLYQAWVGCPQPERWPEHLRGNPTEGQGQYAFAQGLRLGLLLAAEAFYPERS